MSDLVRPGVQVSANWVRETPPQIQPLPADMWEGFIQALMREEDEKFLDIARAINDYTVIPVMESPYTTVTVRHYGMKLYKFGKSNA